MSWKIAYFIYQSLLFFRFELNHLDLLHLYCHFGLLKYGIVSKSMIILIVLLDSQPLMNLSANMYKKHKLLV